MCSAKPSTSVGNSLVGKLLQVEIEVAPVGNEAAPFTGRPAQRCRPVLQDGWLFGEMAWQLHRVLAAKDIGGRGE